MTYTLPSKPFAIPSRPARMMTLLPVANETALRDGQPMSPRSACAIVLTAISHEIASNLKGVVDIQQEPAKFREAVLILAEFVLAELGRRWAEAHGETSNS